jgi:putative heme-binding domain-containing protein
MDGSYRLPQTHSKFWRSRILIAIIAFVTVSQSFDPGLVGADEAQWIWASGSSLDKPIPQGEVCFFRKPINLRAQSEGKVEITADDQYELFVNGHSVGSGKSSRQMQEFDISQFLEIGRNVVAVRVVNVHGDTSALAARVSIRPLETDKWYTFSTGPAWRASTEKSPMWETAVFNDRLWSAPTSFGMLGDTVPWDRDENVVAADQTDQKERFQIQKGFGVQRVLGDDQVGSVIAMTFNEFGHIIVSQEGGPLLLVYDQDEDGVPEKVRTYCEEVKSCQGILAFNGDVFVTGDGPEGVALYRLRDTDRNGTLEKVEAIVKFKGNGGEHGPHGLRLGPDGMIYVAVGSHVQAIGKTGDGQTLVDVYEGDLLPRYEDPGGHGLGIKAPGGTIIRTDATGSKVERIAGGFRNAYDLVFHPSGSMFVHDADMEADIDTAWYRPTALFDVAEGSEFGWRTGWAKWPEYYLDRLPDLLDTGRGSPTGAACYQHYMFPVRYQNSLFLADWSEGRILNVRLKPRGSGFIADSEVFLKGQPLNVTDLEVGPDGAMYFCTGGRGTAGGVYRVVYKGEIPDRMKNLGTGIAAAVRQPQVESAWGRQEIAKIKEELGDQWGQLVAGVAYSDDNPPHYRTQAMDLMQLFGPVPSDELLVELSKTQSEAVRAKSASLMALHPSEATADHLNRLLDDSDARVRRAACEAILRSGKFPESADSVLPLLADEDRTLAFVARRVLERMPMELWSEQVVGSSDPRVTIVGLLAMVNADPTEETCLKVLNRASELMNDFLSDADFVDTLRVCQVALHRGKISPDKVVALRDQIAEEFPAGDNRMNHELIRLAAYLQADDVADRALAFITGDHSEADQTLVAICLQFLSHDWNAEQRFQILKYYEKMASSTSNGALAIYLMNVTRDFAKSLSDDDVKAILEQGSTWRNAALAAIYKLPRPIDDATAKTLRDLDKKLVESPKPGDVERRLRTGIIAMLATAQDEESGVYMRSLWRSEPERRSVIAMALAQKPDGENWDYLVRSLNVLESQSADEVVKSLKSVRVATDDPMAIRQLILLGLRAQGEDKSFENVEQLLEHWTGMQRPEESSLSMQPWQKWYAKTHPDREPAELPNVEDSRWDFDQLVKFLNSDEGKFGDPSIGRDVYAKAQCASCHKYNDHGDAIGPTLTGIGRRYSKREIIESILYPAHVVSNQYASKKVLTRDGHALIGMVAQRNDGAIDLRDANNQVSTIDEQEIDQILPSNSSIMPSGLLDNLSLQEISDLMAYMGVIPKLEVAEKP